MTAERTSSRVTFRVSKSALATLVAGLDALHGVCDQMSGGRVALLVLAEGDGLDVLVIVGPISEAWCEGDMLRISPASTDTNRASEIIRHKLGDPWASVGRDTLCVPIIELRGGISVIDTWMRVTGPNVKDYR